MLKVKHSEFPSEIETANLMLFNNREKERMTIMKKFSITTSEGLRVKDSTSPGQETKK